MRGSAITKRTLDAVLGALLLLLALPVIVIGAVGTAISLQSWPFFTQMRVGRDGELFKFVKLRTLPSHAPRYARKHDIDHLEVPPFSRFLRRHHLDELPQILLVITGHMSLVGPRPEMEFLHEQLDPATAARRTSIRPGCTGLWQIGEHCEAMIHQHPEFDEHYLDFRSLRLDLWILARTLRLLVPFRATRLVALTDLPAWAGGPANELSVTESWAASPGR